MVPRRAFTITEKVDIISRLESGENNVDVCKQLGVSHSTISAIWKNRVKILECFLSKSTKMKRNRKSTYPDIERALLAWFKAQRNQTVISGRLLQEKANQFARQLGKRNFECTGSWIYRFRQRNDIKLGKGDEEAAESHTSRPEEVNDEVKVTDNLTDNKIIEPVLLKEEIEDEEEDCNPCEIPTTQDALCALETLKKYCLFGEGRNKLDLESIVKMEYTLQRAQRTKHKQCTITHFV